MPRRCMTSGRLTPGRLHLDEHLARAGHRFRAFHGHEDFGPAGLRDFNRDHLPLEIGFRIRAAILNSEFLIPDFVSFSKRGRVVAGFLIPRQRREDRVFVP